MLGIGRLERSISIDATQHGAISDLPLPNQIDGGIHIRHLKFFNVGRDSVPSAELQQLGHFDWRADR
jgi:hypothetical protein